MRTNYKDDLLNTSINQNRHYAIKRTSDDSVVEEDIYFEDKTTYLQEGDQFGASDANAITKCLQTNEFTIAIADWTASVASADYPYEALVTTDKYSATFIPTYIDMIPADGSAFFSEAETDAKGLLNQQIVFGASGFTAYASEIPTCPIKLRICGEV